MRRTLSAVVLLTLLAILNVVVAVAQKAPKMELHLTLPLDKTTLPTPFDLLATPGASQPWHSMQLEFKYDQAVYEPVCGNRGTTIIDVVVTKVGSTSSYTESFPAHGAKNFDGTGSHFTLLVPNLDENTEYKFKVRGRCTKDTSFFSQTITARTATICIVAFAEVNYVKVTKVVDNPLTGNTEDLFGTITVTAGYKNDANQTVTVHSFDGNDKIWSVPSGGPYVTLSEFATSATGATTRQYFVPYKFLSSAFLKVSIDIKDKILKDGEDLGNSATSVSYSFPDKTFTYSALDGATNSYYEVDGREGGATLKVRLRLYTSKFNDCSP